MSERPEGRRFSWKRAAFFFVSMACVALAAWVWPIWKRARALESVNQAQVAVKAHDWTLAEQLAFEALRIDPDLPEAQLVAGEVCTRLGRFDEARKHFDAIPRDGSRTSTDAAFASAELWRDAGALSKALADYNYVLEHHRSNLAARERLAFLLQLCGRRWDSLPHLLYQMKNNVAALQTLSILGDLDRPVEQPEYVRKCAESYPDDPMVRLAQLSLDIADGRWADAVPGLRQIVSEDPKQIAAQAMLGEALVDSDQATFDAWEAALPKEADESVEIWFVRGLRARHEGDPQVAARNFWEAVRREPTHRRSNYQLGQVLLALDEPGGREFSERAALFFDLTKTLDDVMRSGGREESLVRHVVELMDQTGRIWEECAWALLATRTYRQAAWAGESLRRHSGKMQPDLPQTIPPSDLSKRFDLTKFPLRRERRSAPQHAKSTTSDGGPAAVIRFVESLDSGIDFVYVNGSDRPPRDWVASSDSESQVSASGKKLPGARMFEQTGGGVAVIDFDLDGLPDLHFTQGAEWHRDFDSPSFSPDCRDRLYRNESAQRYRDVTALAMPPDTGFGQGCATGDFDNDGFPDLYVANLFANQLLRNNGDGTFSDVTKPSDLQSGIWTTSCVIVDLTADGVPDLFDVTYVTADDVFERVCNGHGCSPKVFNGEPDRLHVGRGDGTFEYLPDAVSQSNSKGLGIVAADLRVPGHPDLFIANDQVPNYLLKVATSEEGITLVDEAFVRGTAFNRDGLAMASMGVACDDANGDGLLDFFVTTFKDESSMLLLQDSLGLFVDATGPAGLTASGLQYVGWGTQFLDADLDGDVDLVAVNGHVDDYRPQGGEFQMRSQFYQNQGGGRFLELTGSAAGDFFDRKILGRGLARLDWNGDGRMDFVVSSIGSRASLVTNQTEDGGHFVNVRLHATRTARDAVGTVVEVATGRGRSRRQLTAGDGYMASNERMLQFGLGESVSAINEVVVHWPSGASTRMADVPADSTWVIVEGKTEAIRWNSPGGGPLPVVTFKPD